MKLTYSAPTARVFLNVVAQSSRHLSTSSHYQAPLGFLTPSIPSPSKRLKPSYGSKSSPTVVGNAKKFFSSGSPSRQTATIFNPRKDNDGNDMSVEITPRAANRLSEIATKDANPNLALRIQVESGGCHGFQYLMSLTTLPEAPSYKQELDKEDTVFEAGKAKVVMDGPSLELLKGSKVDFTMELIGSQFKIVDNPLATSSCGCGTSFDIKV